VWLSISEPKWIYQQNDQNGMLVQHQFQSGEYQATVVFESLRTSIWVIFLHCTLGATQSCYRSPMKYAQDHNLLRYKICPVTYTIRCVWHTALQDESLPPGQWHFGDTDTGIASAIPRHGYICLH
jgi:hypothetical protein